MPEKKKGTLAIKKAKKPVLAVRKPQPREIQNFNELLDTFRNEFGGYLWDPYRGFEWPVEYELPMRIPYVDVIDSGNEYVVKAELPGLKKENVQIEVAPNELSITARADVETEEKGKTYLHRERAYSTFRRRIGFGEKIDTEKASANMAEGILEIKLPKYEPKPEKKTKKIKPQ
ncbi:MAG: Hsp20/alpha crystallin family protein [Candidatus Bathyarchaeia archaeon]|jgi:HSP20 family protein